MFWQISCLGVFCCCHIQHISKWIDKQNELIWHCQTHCFGPLSNDSLVMRPKFWPKQSLFFRDWVFRNWNRDFYSTPNFPKLKPRLHLRYQNHCQITNNYHFVFASVVVFFILFYSFFWDQTRIKWYKARNRNFTLWFW